MANKRSLDTPLNQSPTSITQTKKVKFGVLPAKTKNGATGEAPSTFDTIDNSNDLQFDELNQVGKIKKGKVKVDGYDSDSSTENNEVRKNKKSKDDDDMDDIFGEDNSSKDKSNQPKFAKIDVGLKVKKGAEDKDYLDLGDIEGQEFGKEEDEEEEEEEEGDQQPKKKNRLEEVTRNEYSEEEEEEEDFVPGDEFANDDDAPRARRKSKKGMGFLLSKFNMAEELQEGRMAADGSYVASAKDPEAVHDNWLEGVNSKKAIKLARQAKRLRDQQQRSQAEKEESMSSLRTRKDCYIALLGLLPHGDGRSVTQILCQLGNDKRGLQKQQRNESKQTKRLSTQKKNSNGKEDSMMIDNEPTQKNDHNPEQKDGSISRKTRTQLKTEEEIKLDKRIEEITDLSSMLMGTHGELDIYDMSHGSILGILKSEGLVPREWIPPSSNNNIQEEVSKSTGETPLSSKPIQKLLISRPTTLASVTASSTSSSGPTGPSQIFYRFIQQPGSSNPQENLPVYGPFDKNTMISWAHQGFFGINFDKILVQLHNHDSDAWGPWNQIIGDT
ncbi:hypothetical protein Pst134EA_009053 [Puccinia striiformis f. sp. tritici]|uniref:hypothetical protein n=1 Tax=Puccinia striiformis f. sp. tritici TaxID=168172 RepID=UPI000A1257A0|nr:hypothetical protein Pst134EA_009053 [Puccinia striiformis f. sp. tritici]KAH9468514.1 hypothetical protein Pst134EA_009053 [Puccinia striiformis f. sp. tritici]